MEPPNTNTLDKIYQIFDSLQPDEYGCKNWPGTFGHRGLVSIKGKRFKVHRLALERKLGRPIKPGYCALHTCDWPPCVNIDHLYEGTKKNNAQDRKLRNPESYNHLKNPDHPGRFKMRTWTKTPEGREFMRKMQKKSVIARKK